MFNYLWILIRDLIMPKKIQFCERDQSFSDHIKTQSSNIMLDSTSNYSYMTQYHVLSSGRDSYAQLSQNKGQLCPTYSEKNNTTEMLPKTLRNGRHSEIETEKEEEEERRRKNNNKKKKQDTYNCQQQEQEEQQGHIFMQKQIG
jgi:tRNA G37 N-methylase TrmD